MAPQERTGSAEMHRSSVRCLVFAGDFSVLPIVELLFESIVSEGHSARQAHNLKVVSSNLAPATK
jgi:hypothetical protein